MHLTVYREKQHCESYSFVRIAAPEVTTHFKMVMEATELDFGAETSTFESDETTILPYDSANTYNTLTVIDIV